MKIGNVICYKALFGNWVYGKIVNITDTEMMVKTISEANYVWVLRDSTWRKVERSPVGVPTVVIREDADNVFKGLLLDHDGAEIVTFVGLYYNDDYADMYAYIAKKLFELYDEFLADADFEWED